MTVVKETKPTIFDTASDFENGLVPARPTEVMDDQLFAHVVLERVHVIYQTINRGETRCMEFLELLLRGHIWRNCGFDSRSPWKDPIPALLHEQVFQAFAYLVPQSCDLVLGNIVARPVVQFVDARWIQLLQLDPRDGPDKLFAVAQRTTQILCDIPVEPLNSKAPKRVMDIVRFWHCELFQLLLLINENKNVIRLNLSQ